MKYVLLSQTFYNKHLNHTEILQKPGRPYAVLLVKTNGLSFGIPFRSNIRHPNAYLTDRKNNRGIDYSILQFSTLQYFHAELGLSPHSCVFGRAAKDG